MNQQEEFTNLYNEYGEGIKNYALAIQVMLCWRRICCRRLLLLFGTICKNFGRMQNGVRGSTALQ